MTVTFVTAYYKCYPNRDNHDYVDHFLKIARISENPIILFLDPLYANEPFVETIQSLSNVKVIADVPFSDLPVAKMYSRDVVILPQKINTGKDTAAFFILMNSKLDFIQMALSSSDSDSDSEYAWIDFGIAKICKNLDTSWKCLLDSLDQKEKSNTILIPGCSSRVPKVSVDSVVPWRFCGGFFVGSGSTTLLKFRNLAHKQLSLIKPQITWEVNVWAMVENHHEDLFQWYKADHNDTMFTAIPRSNSNSKPVKSVKIVAILMIKNEERIIRRCIDRILASNSVSAICISDTGSTDDTLRILAEYLPTIPIVSRVVNHEWRDFGHNRTLAFQAAVDMCKSESKLLDLSNTYGLLLDADMKYEQVKPFPPQSLSATGYRIRQGGGSVEYYNTRLVRMDYPWKCVSVTHEYWDGATTENISPDIAYIDDVGDGGCKADKFTRDERLLRQGLVEEPRNERYMFYLAQTLKDIKKLPESIEMYKRRVDAGGWGEEIWYSMYQISRLSCEISNLTEMEYWGMRAYDYNPRRAENVYFLTRIFRERSQHHKAWHYMVLGAKIPKPTDLLFIENDVYTHLFDYERTILAYYVQPHKRAESLLGLIQYYNREGGHCYSNLQHYVDAVPLVDHRILPFQSVGDFVPTSTSFVPCGSGSGYLVNVRYVNYRIQPDGSYLMMSNGSLSRDTPVRTRNFMVRTDANFVPYSPLEEMVCPSIQTSSHIQGVEDLRLIDENRWVGTGVMPDGNIRQLCGTYDTATHTLTDAVVLESPTNQRCEKNWISIPLSRFIYSWGPFRILDKDTNQFIHTQKTPRFFEHVRGSSNTVSFEGSTYAIVHVVQYVQPRKYYHMVVKLSGDYSTVLEYTNPFYFKTNAIEYVLAMDITPDGLIKTIVSQNDMNPVLVSIQLKTLKFNIIPN